MTDNRTWKQRSAAGARGKKPKLECLLCGRFFASKDFNNHRKVCWEIMCWSAACQFNPNWDDSGWKELVEKLKSADEIQGNLENAEKREGGHDRDGEETPAGRHHDDAPGDRDNRGGGTLYGEAEELWQEEVKEAAQTWEAFLTEEGTKDYADKVQAQRPKGGDRTGSARKAKK